MKLHVYLECDHACTVHVHDTILYEPVREKTNNLGSNQV